MSARSDIAVKRHYFLWMYEKVDPDHTKYNYSMLMSYLFQREYTYTIDKDENRMADGLSMRRNYILNYEPTMDPDEFMPNEPCSVLEMLVALAIRCDRDIMGDPLKGDDPAYWFWTMLWNLGLRDMDNEHFDRDTVAYHVDIWLSRSYDSRGIGGLFPRCRDGFDQREMEIWDQMNGYLIENYF